MFMLEPPRTQFDLNWRMFGIPVRVHPFFWLTSVILGWSTVEEGIEFLPVWIACVFVSILVHELGHVCMARLFREDGYIVLYSFGGLAIHGNRLPHRWQRIAVSFAGPLAGFVFLGLIVLGFSLLVPERLPLVVDYIARLLGFDTSGGRGRFEPHVAALVFDLITINLLWGLLNLLPIWPLDGGQISGELWEIFLPGRGLRSALWLSVVIAGLLAVHFLMAYNGKPLFPFLQNTRDLFPTLMFAYLAVNSYYVLTQLRPDRESSHYERYEKRAPWERDPDYWKQ